MDGNQRFLALIERLYAAPGTVEGWSTFLEALREDVNGLCAHLMALDSHKQSSVAVTVRTDPSAVSEYLAHWYTSDPWGTSPRMQVAAAGTVLLADEMIPEPRLKASEYYNEFARRYELVRCMAGVLEINDGVRSILSLNRAAGQRAFTEQDRALIQALVPNIRSALHMHRRIALAESQSNHLADALERVACAVFIVQSDARVQWMNSQASRLVARADGLTLDGKSLRAANSGDTLRLRTTLAAALSTSTTQTTYGGRLYIGRPSGARPFAVNIARCGQRTPNLFHSDARTAMVLVSDPDRVSAVDLGTFQEAYRLTRSEVDLVSLLVRGFTVEECAEQLSIQVTTARKRLKSIFEKTTTHRQADLVGLVLALEGPLG